MIRSQKNSLFKVNSNKNSSPFSDCMDEAEDSVADNFIGWVAWE